jgi:hypothetical protein
MTCVRSAQNLYPYLGIFYPDCGERQAPYPVVYVNVLNALPTTSVTCRCKRRPARLMMSPKRLCLMPRLIQRRLH